MMVRIKSTLSSSHHDLGEKNGGKNLRRRMVVWDERETWAVSLQTGFLAVGLMCCFERR